MATSSAVAIAATPSPRPVRPSPSVVVAETDTGAPTAARRPGLVAPWAETGPVADHLHGDVDDLEPGRAHPAGGLGQQGGARRAGPLGLGGAEVRAQVAQVGGGEERVAGRVRRHVGVGVALETGLLVGPGEPGQVHLGARHQPVHVGADTGAQGGVRRRGTVGAGALLGGAVHIAIMPERGPPGVRGG